MGPRLGTMRPEYQYSDLIKDSIEVKDFLKWVTGKVSEYGDMTFTLKNPAGARWKIGGLEDTIYKGNDGKLNRWGKFYLSKIVTMKVVGVVEQKSYPYDHLVLMTCEDRKLYAFDGEEEELHMVAENLEKLLLDGLKYPSSERYPKRQPSKEMLQGACGEDEDSRSEARLTLKQKRSDGGKKEEKDSGIGSAGSDSDWSKEQLQTSDDEPGPSNTKTKDQLSVLLKESTKVKDKDYLTWVSGFVSKNGQKTFTLKNPDGATWKIGGLDDTDYNDEELNRWGKFYLPKIVNMKVVGVVEETSCPCDQLVLMTCEDRKVYAFDGEEEELHMVAESLEKLAEKGLMYPSSQSYYKGEAFKNVTEKYWDEVRNSPVGKKLDDDHRKLVEEKKSELLKKLKSTKVAAADQSCLSSCLAIS